MPTETRPTSWPRSKARAKPILDDRIAKIRGYARPKNATSRMATTKMHARALASVTTPENHREPGILGSAVF
jgi:hypothetical protein